MVKVMRFMGRSVVGSDCLTVQGLIFDHLYLESGHVTVRGLVFPMVSRVVFESTAKTIFVDKN
jgi:hypothetical protein